MTMEREESVRNKRRIQIAQEKATAATTRIANVAAHGTLFGCSKQVRFRGCDGQVVVGLLLTESFHSVSALSSFRSRLTAVISPL